MTRTIVVQSRFLEIAVGLCQEGETANCRYGCTGHGRQVFSKVLDLNMLAMTGGRERTKAEFRALLDAADYKLTRIIPTMAPQSVLEAVSRVSN